ncbi:hypothetical protein Vafri_12447 [Volvox africanus]|uniref:Alpha-ketoglutarate-dependent dioxygenase AlkB-like domain-containing protein n=1 Tax=Volvox africanus TaxID=51714 RepID=A0A8J4F1J7_9CHLO|nr:hypothetical protein Vafri_12447 [Volvox africanus]
MRAILSSRLSRILGFIPLWQLCLQSTELNLIRAFTREVNVVVRIAQLYDVCSLNSVTFSNNCPTKFPMCSGDSGLTFGSEWYRKYRVAPHLPSLFYVQDYVVPEQEAALLREVRASKSKWVQLSGRRLQNLGGVVHSKGLIPAPLPSWLEPLLTRLAGEGGEGGLYGGKPPNHVLVNSYLPGEGIMPHEDGPAYHPVVAILSLGAPAVLRFRKKPRSAEGAWRPQMCPVASGLSCCRTLISPPLGGTDVREDS